MARRPLADRSRRGRPRRRRDLPVHPRRPAEIPPRLEDRGDPAHPAALVKALGTVGHIARAVIFGLVAIFLVKASYDYRADEAIGLDGALAKLYNGAYGSWLLGAVALGLILFSVFCLAEARYRRI
jgi:hypothetical protein